MLENKYRKFNSKKLEEEQFKVSTIPLAEEDLSYFVSRSGDPGFLTRRKKSAECDYLDIIIKFMASNLIGEYVDIKHVDRKALFRGLTYTIRRDKISNVIVKIHKGEVVLLKPNILKMRRLLKISTSVVLKCLGTR